MRNGATENKMRQHTAVITKIDPRGPATAKDGDITVSIPRPVFQDRIAIKESDEIGYSVETTFRGTRIAGRIWKKDEEQ